MRLLALVKHERDAHHVVPVAAVLLETRAGADFGALLLEPAISSLSVSHIIMWSSPTIPVCGVLSKSGLIAERWEGSPPALADVGVGVETGAPVLCQLSWHTPLQVRRRRFFMSAIVAAFSEGGRSCPSTCLQI